MDPTKEEITDDFQRLCTEFVDKMDMLLDLDGLSLVCTKIMGDGTVRANYFFFGPHLINLHGTSGMTKHLVKQLTAEILKPREREDTPDETE